MKLWQVVAQGRFCGLETVEECISNFYIHGIDLFPYNALEYELRELRSDIQAYEAGNLDLPWDRINESVAACEAAYEEWAEQNEPVPEEEDLEFRLNNLP
jgi:hypothetical protein